MSYILDALKKSDIERKQSEFPTPLTSWRMYSDKKIHSPKRPFYALVILSLISITSVFLNLYFLYQVKDASLPEKEELTVTSPQDQSSIKQDEDTIQDKTMIATKKIESISSIILEPSPLLLNNQTAPAEVISSAEQLSLPFLDELPANIKRAIPKLQYAGHTYSELPAERIVMINAQILREGDFIQPGLQLKQITWNGVTLDFHGTAFHDNLK